MQKLHCDSCGAEITPGEQVALAHDGADKVVRSWPMRWIAGHPIAPAVTRVDLCQACWDGLKHIVSAVKAAAAADAVEVKKAQATAAGQQYAE